MYVILDTYKINRCACNLAQKVRDETTKIINVTFLPMSDFARDRDSIVTECSIWHLYQQGENLKSTHIIHITSKMVEFKKKKMISL